jgi:hypothetical protein
MGARDVEIIEILDHWPSQDHHYYKVRSEDHCVYILRHDSPAQRWEVTMFERRNHEEDQDEEEHVFRHTFRGQV